MSTAGRKFPVGVVILALIGWFSIVVAWLHLGLERPDHSIKDHHLQHLFFLIGGSLWGIALARFVARRGERARNGAWLAPALLAPMVAMFLMWPSAYPYVEARPALHMSMHVVFVLLGVLTTYAAYQYSQTVSWLLGGSLAAMAWVAAYFFGVPPTPNPAVTAILNAKPAVTADVSADTAAGQEVFAQVCAACHMPTGTGLPGAFPPLAGHFPEVLAAGGGHDYAVSVVLFGLQGAINVSGQAYNSIMPPQQQLTDQQVADVLNYVAVAWGNEPPAGAEPFTPEGVAAIRGQGLSSQQVQQARGDLGLP